MDKYVYELLTTAAWFKFTVTYCEVAREIELELQSSANRKLPVTKRADVSMHEHRLGRPLLSVVVANSQTRLPEIGFFGMARRLGRYVQGSEEESFRQESERSIWDLGQKVETSG